jgi:ubiquinone/menaquinone biosynthesis C-methylase UbiE
MALKKKSVIKGLDKTGNVNRIMDIPTGTGRITEFLFGRAKNVLAGDISEEMMAIAMKKFQGKNISFACIYAENMTLKNNSVECITCVRLMGHIRPEQRVKMLTEMAQVSRTWVLVTFYFSNIISDTKRALRRKLTGNRSPWWPTTTKAILNEITAVGLEIVETYAVLPIMSEAVTYLMKTKAARLNI